MTTGKLTKFIEEIKHPEDAPRNYIGASIIGDSCSRKIWYELKCYEGSLVSNTTRRTWDIGKQLEELIITWLKRSPSLLLSKANIHNNFLSCVDSELSYFQGHCDAMILMSCSEHSVHALIEIKTAKDSSFQQFVKNGLKKWSPKYYAQVQSYMGMSGIHEAYIIVLNKDTSDLWDEQVIYDNVYYQTLRAKAKMIYESESEPPRVSNSPMWFECKMCRFREICHK